MMRTTRLQSLQMAAALLCALTAGQALAQAAATTPAAQAETPASTAGGFLPPASANAKVIDSIQVVVNDEVITRNEVAGRVAQVSQNMKARNAQMPDPATMERQVLEAMIVERAQLQLAKEMGVKVDDRTLDATIGRIAENQKMSVQDMRNQMEKEGMPFAQFREDIRNEIMMQRLREHEVDSKIQISEAEVDTYMAASVWPALTTVRQPVASMARLAASLLVREGEDWLYPEFVDAGEVRTIDIEAEPEQLPGDTPGDFPAEDGDLPVDAPPGDGTPALEALPSIAAPPISPPAPPPPPPAPPAATGNTVW